MPNEQEENRLFVNTSLLSPDESYVCWIDIMGTRNTMSDSFEKAANYIIRFHTCCIDSIQGLENINCYPMMDGIYITSDELSSMKVAIEKIYQQLSELFLREDVPFKHKFVIRGALAFGEIFHGKNITNRVNREIASNSQYKKQLLFGLPMIQAFTSERNAPPFGVYIHESARKVGQLQGRYYNWLRDESENRLLMKESLNQYFDCCKEHHNQLDMETNKIDKYKELINEYFSD